ncbi:AraC family transcriptional regulator [Tomitella fengzijianii]|uniref:AraC family transcriptional regulator n=1 Tax=Tomitella fengzijianii TaxID=2597660 RepID=A0A516X7Z0_9ACTN|nr:AraC family transcriptional regulator [Tomitella fengzijianii]QDQ99178.1 AraC family transcriptional regulator [Tomitella fengzijianii]
MKPLARYASLNKFFDLCRSLDTDPVPLIRAANLDLASLRQQDRWVPAESIVVLLEHAAATTRRADFGLRLAALRTLSNLGPLSMAMREEPDVRRALQMLVRYERMYNEAIRTRMVEAGGVATIRTRIDVGRPSDATAPQSVDLAVGVIHGVLSEFLGPGWRPASVSFAHPEPTDISTYIETFRTVVKFGQDFNGVVLPSSELDAKNPLSDPLMRPYAHQFLDDVASSHETSPIGRVRDLIEMLLPTGRCSTEQVARSLGVDRRTVHRWLAAEGHTFSSVLDDVRGDLGAHLVTNPHNSMTDISTMLGFSASSNFSRWFKTRFGMSPRQWRARRAAEDSMR